MSEFMSEGKKECLHSFRSVYYGSEWEVECTYCDENVYDLYDKEKANNIIELMIDNNKRTKNERNNSSLVQLWRSICSSSKENH